MIPTERTPGTMTSHADPRPPRSRRSASSIRAGDLVRVGGAGAFYAEVLRTSRDGMPRGRLLVRGLAAKATREVLVRELIAHWRRAS